MPKPLLKFPAPGIAARVLCGCAEWLGLTPPFSVDAGIFEATAETMGQVSSYFPVKKYEIEGTWFVGSSENLISEVKLLERIFGQYSLKGGGGAYSISISKPRIELRTWEAPDPFRLPFRLLGVDIPIDSSWHEIQAGISVTLSPKFHLQISGTGPMDLRITVLPELLDQIGQIEEIRSCHAIGSHAGLQSLELSGRFAVDRGGLARGLYGLMGGPTTEKRDVLIEALDMLERDPAMSGFLKLRTRVSGLAPKPMEVYLVWTRSKGKPADIELSSLDRLPAEWKKSVVDEIRQIERRLFSEAEG